MSERSFGFQFDFPADVDVSVHESEKNGVKRVVVQFDSIHEYIHVLEDLEHLFKDSGFSIEENARQAANHHGSYLRISRTRPLVK